MLTGDAVDGFVEFRAVPKAATSFTNLQVHTDFHELVSGSAGRPAALWFAAGQLASFAVVQASEVLLGDGDLADLNQWAGFLRGLIWKLMRCAVRGRSG
jgi:hypothetical protein